MVIYPGQITIGRGQPRGEACVAITVADAAGRAEPVVVPVDLAAFGRAPTGEGRQPCAVRVRAYVGPVPAAPAGPVADENIIYLEGDYGRDRLRGGGGVRGGVGRAG